MGERHPTAPKAARSPNVCSDPWSFTISRNIVAEAQLIEHIKGTNRLRAAKKAFPEFPRPDSSQRLYQTDDWRAPIHRAPDWACIYMVTAWHKRECLTLYVGETSEPWERFRQHWPRLDDAFSYHGALQARMIAFKNRLGGALKKPTLHVWRCQSIRRRIAERMLVNATGAILEYRDRKVETCLPE